MADARAGLPAPPPEVPCDTSIGGLAPRFLAAVMRVLQAVPEAVIVETCRTEARQAYLYGFGRFYDDGRGVVTRAESARSGWHFYGLAVDVVHRTLRWDAPPAWWRRVGDAARKEGLAWGGDWPQFPDSPHIQWGAPMRRSPSDEARALYAQGGKAAVWRAVGAD